MALLPPYGRVTYKGVTLNRRTVAMLKWVQRKVKIDLLLAQGSYTGGKVAASGSTHDRGGAVDVRIVNLDVDERKTVVHAMKDAGFAAWFREYNWDGNGGGPHIHGIAIEDKELSSGAAWQVVAFDAGRNGLTGNQVDPTYRPKPKVKWGYLLQRPRTR